MNSKCLSCILATIIIYIGSNCIYQNDLPLFDSFTIIMALCIALSVGVFMPDTD